MKLNKENSPNLTLSDFRTYIYVRNPKTVATPVRIYTYMDFAIETWGFTGIQKTFYSISPRAVHVLPVCWHPLLSMFTKSEKSGVYSEMSAVFGEFLKITIVSSSLGMEYNGEFYGFSAVKVKLVDSFRTLIDALFINCY